MDKTIEELKAKHAAELAKFEKEQAILSRLPDVGHQWMVSIHELYGTVATVWLRQPYSYGEKHPTLQDLLTIAEALPGVTLVKVKGNFTTYLPKQNLPRYEYRNSVKSEEPLAPWIVNASGGPGARNGSQCDVEWWTDLDGIGTVSVSFELPFMMALRFAARRVDHVGGYTWKGCRCEVDRAKLFTIYGPDGSTPVAQHRDGTTWAAGSSEYPNKITAAWEPLDDPCKATVADFARALIKANQKPE